MTPEELKTRREQNIPDPEGVQFGPNGELEDHPLDMIKALEGKGVSTEDGTLINLLSQEEVEALKKMLKHGEFNQKETALLKYLLYIAGKDVNGNLFDIATILGAIRPKGNGQPTSKQYAFGKMQDILKWLFTVKAPKFGIKMKKGKTAADLVKFMDLNRKTQKLVDKQKKEKEVASKKAQREAMKEFWELYKSNNKLRRELGLPTQGLKDLQTTIDELPNKDGSRGLTSKGEKVKLPIVSVNYKGGSDKLDLHGGPADKGAEDID